MKNNFKSASKKSLARLFVKSFTTYLSAAFIFTTPIIIKSYSAPVEDSIKDECYSVIMKEGTKEADLMGKKIGMNCSVVKDRYEQAPHFGMMQKNRPSDPEFQLPVRVYQIKITNGETARLYFVNAKINQSSSKPTCKVTKLSTYMGDALNQFKADGGEQ